MSDYSNSVQPTALELLGEIIERSSSPEDYKSVLFSEGKARPEVLDLWTLDSLEKYLAGLEFNLPDSSRKLVEWSALVRNVLVFTPVAVTWHAISVATAGFDAFLKENPEVPANFLQFWQDGYGYIDPIWTIGSVANIDFLLVGLVILLTGFVSFQTQRKRTRQLGHQQRMKRSINLLLARLNYLQPTQSGTAGEIRSVGSVLAAEPNQDISKRLLVGQLKSFLDELESNEKK